MAGETHNETGLSQWAKIRDVDLFRPLPAISNSSVRRPVPPFFQVVIDDGPNLKNKVRETSL
jgi:hypothetical protein